MGYQALLFCPDEKTARTVTQVLSELDFEVVPCTEPFAAVKKLMGEHFDAVVVDCDNEQNATLLFKSARNSPNNQSALAVAVVEGQAGVAKAFRIGANLVLTKPINVEQAKGTLRVARGLLRKNEGAKPAATTTATTPKPATSGPAPAKPTLVPSPAVPRPLSVVSPHPAPSTPPQKVVHQPSFAASASSALSESGEDKRSVEAASQSAAPSNIASITASDAKRDIKPIQEIAPTLKGPSPVSSAGAASAAAPAPEVASIAAPEKPSTATPDSEPPAVKIGNTAESSSTEDAVSPAPSFTFGGAIESDAKSSSGGSKKILLAVAAVVVIAAAGYVGWTKMPHSDGAANTPAPVIAKPAAPAISHDAPSATAPPAADSSAATPVIPASTAPTHSAAPAKSGATAQTVPDAGNAKDRKANAEDSSRPAQAVLAENNVPATSSVSQPIVVKNGTAETTLAKPSPSDEAAPTITAIASAGNGGTLPNLLGNQSTAPTPVLQTLNVSQGVSQGLAIQKTQPSYPANALRMGIEGSVQLMATISKKGDISAVKVLSGDPSLARAAADAVKQWKYKPYLLDGVPVEIQTQVTVNFKLPR
ncbi:MAG: TonB family protein [Candidatus Sulfotelmatobacter sp.]